MGEFKLKQSNRALVGEFKLKQSNRALVGEFKLKHIFLEVHSGNYYTNWTADIKYLIAEKELACKTNNFP